MIVVGVRMKWTRKIIQMKCCDVNVQAQEQECNKKLKGLIATANNHAARIQVTNTQEFLTSKIKETEKIIK